MDLKKLLYEENEKPLDRIVTDGGYTRIFRTIGCIGDSLSSGELESRDENGNAGYHDFYEYSWGQYMARNAGLKVFNFSCGGMTAKKYIESYGDRCGCWATDRLCQAYILALGVNDLYTKEVELGSISDVDTENPENSKPTFAGYYGRIISKLQMLTPDSKFFLVTLPRVSNLDVEGHAALLRKFPERFKNTYVIDLAQYGPDYDGEFKKKFFVGGHMNAAGYILSAQMITSYIDYTVRHNFEDFSQVGFIGTPYKYL